MKHRPELVGRSNSNGHVGVLVGDDERRFVRPWTPSSSGMAAIASIAASGSRAQPTMVRSSTMGSKRRTPPAAVICSSEGHDAAKQGQQRFDDVGGPGERVRRGPVFHPVRKPEGRSGRGTGMSHCPNPCRGCQRSVTRDGVRRAVGRRTGTVRPPPVGRTRSFTPAGWPRASAHARRARSNLGTAVRRSRSGGTSHLRRSTRCSHGPLRSSRSSSTCCTSQHKQNSYAKPQGKDGARIGQREDR